MTSIGLPEAATRVAVLVTGGRDYDDEATIRRAWDAAEMAARWLWRDPYSFALVHGAARGADRLAEVAAQERGWLIVESAPGVRGFPADWDRYGRAAGQIRNTVMVDYMRSLSGNIKTMCVGFPTLGSVGTYDCLRKARAAGIWTWHLAPGQALTDEIEGPEQ